jgi:hypothetical protein
MTHSIDENRDKGTDKSFFWAVPEYYFFAEFRSVPFRASEWALP